MSEFLGFESFLVSLGSSMEDVKTTALAALTSRGWQIIGNIIGYQSVIGSATNGANAFDGARLSTAATVTTPGGTIGLQLLSPEEISSYSIAVDKTGYWTQSPRTWTLEYSDNGTNWFTADTQTNQNPWNYKGDLQTFTIAGNPGAHLYWRINITSCNSGSTCYIDQIVFYTKSGAAQGRCIGTNPALIMVPPATETIGNANQREVVGFIINGTTLKVRAGVQTLKDTPQIIGIHSATAGVSQSSITMGGVTVSGATGTSGSTANDNLWSLFLALKASSDPNFTAWDWFHQKAPAQNATDTKNWVYGVKKAYGPIVTVGQTNCTQLNLAIPSKAGWMLPIETWGGSHGSDPMDLTIDLVSGFVYYAQVNARGFAIATKTNVGVYGPIHVCYGDHQKALDSVPYCPIPWLVNPIELIVGTDGAASANTATAYPAKYWAMGQGSTNLTDFLGWEDLVNYGFGAPGSGAVIRSMFTDFCNFSYWSSSKRNLSVPLGLSGLVVDSTAANLLDDFQVHSMKMMGVAVGTMLGSQIGFVPMVDTSDWYRFRGTVTNEALVLAADTTSGATLQTAMNGTTDAPTVLVMDSVANFADAGFVVIGDEAFSYTGRNVGANQLTGITRARYGSTKQDHWTGDRVFQALWFTAINGGALFCGFTRPV